MVRSPRKENQSVLKKGAWAPEEDRKLIAYIHRYGIWNWSQMPTFAGLSRSGKSCRLRWLNYLSPDVKRGNFTEKEVEIIISMYQKFGSRWSLIAKELPGRTDNEIKNYWHTHLKKLLSISKNNLVPSVHEDDDDDEDNNSDPELVPIQENPHEEIKHSVLHFPQVSVLERYNYQQLAADDTSSSGSDDADDEGRRQLETAFAEMNISGDSHNSHEIHNNNNIPSSWTEDFMLENFCMEEEDIFPSWSPLVDPLYPTFCFYNDLYCDILFNFSDKRGTADSEEPFFSF